MPMTKAEIRKQYITKRKQLSQAEYNCLNQELLQQFQQLDLSAVKVIHLFLPIHERKEPDTFLIRQWLEANHPQITRVFPKADFAHHTMQNFADDESLELAVNAFGIPEPVVGNLINPTQIDLVLVPLLAFDKQGYRVGYGKGFYDRFLAQCRPEVQSVGLSFFEPVNYISDINSFDIKMDLCITPNHLFKLPNKVN
jgi:5-formyltetrahydrofolate cyclo-ligase